MKKIEKDKKLQKNRLPRQIKVGPYVYKIVERKNLCSYDGKPAYGLINVEEGKISIEKNLSKRLKQVALLHELCHAILISSGLSMTTKDVHLAVDSISNGLIELLTKHKSLKKYLAEK